MNQSTLMNHKLATQPLRDLLSMAGSPTTPEEKRILASLVSAYQRMRGTFPTKQHGDYLDALYTEAFSVVNRTVAALSALESHYGVLAIETKELSKEEALNAVFQASGELNPDIAPVIKRCHELLFLTLAKAGTWINAVLKAAKKKK